LRQKEHHFFRQNFLSEEKSISDWPGPNWSLNQQKETTHQSHQPHQRGIPNQTVFDEQNSGARTKQKN
jgi:hypothetical protein